MGSSNGMGKDARIVIRLRLGVKNSYGTEGYR
jgi:hypothetical protein